MKCFYHNDADGICAGYWVLQYDVEYQKEDFIKINYGMPFPLDIIQADETVWIVDYSIEPDEMLKLLEITKDVIWIDHHKTAIDKYDNFPYPIEGIRCDGIAGCMLTYLYITENGTQDNAPWFTKYIADYDVWKFEYGEDTRLFQVAFVAHNFEPWSQEWEEFFEAMGWSYEAELIDAGREMIKFRDGWAKNVMETGFEVWFEGYWCYAVNLPLCNSDYFKSLEKEYDIFMPFYWNGKTNLWTISLYSTGVDTSEVSKRYGGGGHKQASGFQCSKLPFIKED